ncbi:MAG TPA: hypothetical protein VK400_10000 [Pyrinomonadaceae bacterium]|nr:hypothetical protein [Pyrinomonadaceae bacterium]
MKNSKFKIQNLRFIFCILHFAFCLSVNAQSTNQDFPTPVTTSEISGKISARDVGDARLTNYFYAFSGTQGDVFINVTATNLNGDIDVFMAGSLKPLTKISLYAGDSTTETGRVVYLRKPEKLILRIEGRTPNDNPATFSIKFAGSFVPLEPAATAATEEPKLPEIKPNENSGVRVNSVGTIIEIKPKPTPQPKETTAKSETENPSAAEETPKQEENKASEEAEKEEEKSAKVAVTEEKPKAGEETPVKIRTPRRRRAAPATARTTTRTAKTKTPADAEAGSTPKPTKNETPKEPAPNPLADVRLIVQFKDGTTLERPMSEVSRVNVDNKGMLTIVLKDGKIERHSILNVAKMTIE